MSTHSGRRDWHTAKLDHLITHSLHKHGVTDEKTQYVKYCVKQTRRGHCCFNTILLFNCSVQIRISHYNHLRKSQSEQHSSAFLAFTCSTLYWGACYFHLKSTHTKNKKPIYRRARVGYVIGTYRITIKFLITVHLDEHTITPESNGGYKLCHMI